MRALLLGGTGLLGRALARAAEERGFDVAAPSRREAPLEDPARIEERCRRQRAEVVINAAAFTGVDACEERREEAMRTNGEAVGALAAVCERSGARLVQVSTDYVFGGERRTPYPEDAEPRPLSVYGESKLLGERYALRGPRALVVRTSWLFGPDGRDFVTAMLDLAASGRSLRVVSDQVGCPTYTPFLARAIWDLVAARADGLVHYRNREPVSWHGFAVEIFRRRDPALEVEAISTAEFPRAARRPAYSVLDVGRFEGLVGRRVEAWADGLDELLARLGPLPAGREA